MPNISANSNMPSNWIDSIFRKRFHGLLNQLQTGSLKVRDGFDLKTFGNDRQLEAEISVRSPAFYRNITGGSAEIGASFIRGEWECADLTSLFKLFLRNQNIIEGLNRWQSFAAKIGRRIGHWLNRNSRDGSRKNIAAHYDLGNDFYRIWLDDSMAYSCGIFDQHAFSSRSGFSNATRDQILHQASLEKFDRTCRKLQLDERSRVLEIGTGWGGYAIYASKQFGCHVTSTTISQAQYDYARAEVSKAGLHDQINLQQQDYRDLRGKYDRLVSIEMIEAVGYRYFDQFFSKCNTLLKDDGSMLIQAIVMPEKRYSNYLKSVDFIQKHVFPGGCLPSVASILESVGRCTDMRLVHLEDMAPHYAKTLESWREKFLEHIEDITSLGYSTELVRTWYFYLAYCEAAFAERSIGVVQMVFDKARCNRDPVVISDLAARPINQRNASLEFENIVT